METFQSSRYRRTGLALLAFAAWQPSFAGNMTGVIEKVHLGPVYGSKVFIKVNGSATGQPACQSNNNYQFVFDADSAVGRALLATALAAQVSGQQVRVEGYNQCSMFVNVEDLRWLDLGG